MPNWHTHLTMWLLSDSICSSEISRSVVDGTPSSSICINKHVQVGSVPLVAASWPACHDPSLLQLISTTYQPQRCSCSLLTYRTHCPPPSSAQRAATARAHLQPRLLQRHQPARVLVAGLVHLAIGALPNLLYLLIVLLQQGSRGAEPAAAAAIRAVGQGKIERGPTCRPPTAD